MKRFASSVALAALLVPGLTSCKSSMTAPEPVLAAVTNAPTTLTVGSSPVTVNGNAWRDFMPGPGAPAGGSGLMVTASVQTNQATPLPADLTIGSVWVLNGDQLWSTTQVENRRDTPFVQTGVARNGPRWDPGAQVTLVVGVRTGDGPEQFVRAQAVPIGRTD
jgi:hypothetical protein